MAMDSQNVRNILRITGGDPEHKARKLMDCTEHGGDVADPQYTGDFDATYRDMAAGCKALLETLLREDGSTR